jgi:hypothetical protein
MSVALCGRLASWLAAAGQLSASPASFPACRRPLAWLAVAWLSGLLLQSRFLACRRRLASGLVFPSRLAVVARQYEKSQVILGTYGEGLDGWLPAPTISYFKGYAEAMPNFYHCYIHLSLSWIFRL